MDGKIDGSALSSVVAEGESIDSHVKHAGWPSSRPATSPAKRNVRWPELKRAIFNYLSQRNGAPQRYIWKAEGTRILAKIQRVREALAGQNR